VVKAKPDCERFGKAAIAGLRPEVAAAKCAAIEGGRDNL
jgi:hypothetical protein